MIYAVLVDKDILFKFELPRYNNLWLGSTSLNKENRGFSGVHNIFVNPELGLKLFPVVIIFS